MCNWSKGIYKLQNKGRSAKKAYREALISKEIRKSHTRKRKKKQFRKTIVQNGKQNSTSDVKKGKEITCCTVGKTSAQFLRQPLEVPWSGARKPYACNSMLWPHLGPPRNPPPGTFPLAVARALVEHSLDPASSRMTGTMKWRLETPPIVLHKQHFPWPLFRQNRSSLHQS